MKINYVTQMKRFMEIYHESELGRNELTLYAVLLEINNSLAHGSEWADSFTQSLTQLVEKTKIGSRSSLIRSRDKLVKMGLIKYNSKGATQGRAARWSIADLSST